MHNPIEKILEPVVKLVRFLYDLPTRFWVIAMLLCLWILLGSGSLADFLGFPELRASHRSQVTFTLLTSTSMILENALRWAINKIKTNHQKFAVLMRLSSLHHFERALLREMVVHNMRSIKVPTLEVDYVTAADCLVSKGLLLHTPGTTWLNQSVYAVPDFVWEYLTDNRAGLPESLAG